MLLIGATSHNCIQKPRYYCERLMHARNVGNFQFRRGIYTAVYSKAKDDWRTLLFAAGACKPPCRNKTQPCCHTRESRTFALLTWRGLSVLEGGLLSDMRRSTSCADLVGLAPRSVSASAAGKEGSIKSPFPPR